MEKAEILSTPTEILSLLKHAEKQLSVSGRDEWMEIIEKLNNALDGLCDDIITPSRPRIPTKAR